MMTKLGKLRRHILNASWKKLWRNVVPEYISIDSAHTKHYGDENTERSLQKLATGKIEEFGLTE